VWTGSRRTQSGWFPSPEGIENWIEILSYLLDLFHLFILESEALFELLEALLDECVEPLADALEHDQSQWDAGKCVAHAKCFSDRTRDRERKEDEI